MIGLSAFKALPEIPPKALAQGYHLEFTGLVDPPFYSEEFLANVRKLPHFGAFQSAHGPFYDLMPGSLDLEVAELAANKFRRALAACASLGIPKVVFHTGWIPHFYTDQQWITNSVRFWKAIAAVVPPGLTVCLENNLEPSPHLIADILDGVGSPILKSCLDVGHVNVHSPQPVAAWVEALGPQIDHVHLHNNFGDTDSHHGLLQGTLPMAEVLEVLRTLPSPTITWNLEIRDGIDASLEFMNQYRGR